MFDEDWQIAIGNYCGQILHHLPSHALLVQKLKEGKFKYNSPHQILQHALFVIQNAKLLVKWKDLLSGQWKGPDPLLTSGRGCACNFPQDTDSPLWIPDRQIRHVAVPQASSSPIASKGTPLPLPPPPPPDRTAVCWEPWVGPAWLPGPSARRSQLVAPLESALAWPQAGEAR